jgi:hypothetical protein
MAQVRFIDIPGRQIAVLFDKEVIAGITYRKVAMHFNCCCCPCYPWVTRYDIHAEVTSDIAEWECTLEDGCIANLVADTIDVRACEPFGPDYDFPPVLRRKTTITGLSSLELDVTLHIDPDTCCFTVQDIHLGTITRRLEVDVADPNEFDDWMRPPCYGARPTPVTLVAVATYDVYLEVTCNEVSYKYVLKDLDDPCNFFSGIWVGYFVPCDISTGNLFTNCVDGEETCCMPDDNEFCPTYWTNTSDIESCVTMTWTALGLL